jgi:hypothetical protein
MTLSITTICIECHYAERIPNVVMLNVVMLCVIVQVHKLVPSLREETDAFKTALAYTHLLY